jgi:hypothetical protein
MSRMIKILVSSVPYQDVGLSGYSLLSFDEAGIIRFQPHKATLSQFPIVDMVIRLGSKHGLDEISDIAKDDSKSFGRWSRACKRLDLDALYNGGQVLAGRTIEDGFEGALINSGGRVVCHCTIEQRANPQ